MFVLKQSDSYDWTVKVDFPVSGDKYQTQSFKAEFNRLSQTRIEELQKQVEEEQISGKDFVKEIVIGWKEVNDENGQPIEFSPAALEKLCDIPIVARAIVKAFFASINGAKTKN